MSDDATMADAVATAVERARSRGCVCEVVPEVTRQVCFAHWPPQVHVRVRLWHDRWCPLLRSHEGPVS